MRNLFPPRFCSYAVQAKALSACDKMFSQVITSSRIARIGYGGAGGVGCVFKSVLRVWPKAKSQPSEPDVSETDGVVVG